MPYFVAQMPSQVKFEHPNHAKDKARARKQQANKEGGMPQKISLAACPSGRRAGWAVRRFDFL